MVVMREDKIAAQALNKNHLEEMFKIAISNKMMLQATKPRWLLAVAYDINKKPLMF